MTYFHIYAVCNLQLVNQKLTLCALDIPLSEFIKKMLKIQTFWTSDSRRYSLMGVCAKLQQINQYNNYVVHFFFMFGSNRLIQRNCKHVFLSQIQSFFSLGVNCFPNLKSGFRLCTLPACTRTLQYICSCQRK